MRNSINARKNVLKVSLLVFLSANQQALAATFNEERKAQNTKNIIDKITHPKDTIEQISPTQQFRIELNQKMTQRVGTEPLDYIHAAYQIIQDSSHATPSLKQMAEFQTFSEGYPNRAEKLIVIQERAQAHGHIRLYNGDGHPFAKIEGKIPYTKTTTKALAAFWPEEVEEIEVYVVSLGEDLRGRTLRTKSGFIALVNSDYTLEKFVSDDEMASVIYNLKTAESEEFGSSVILGDSLAVPYTDMQLEELFAASISFRSPGGKGFASSIVRNGIYSLIVGGLESVENHQYYGILQHIVHLLRENESDATNNALRTHRDSAQGGNHTLVSHKEVIGLIEKVHIEDINESTWIRYRESLSNNIRKTVNQSDKKQTIAITKN